MKTVVSNEMVAHIWAQQNEQTYARNSNESFWFRDTTLYSYRTPIANMVDSVFGERIVLISCDSYSATTASKHLSPARSAVSHRRSFHVPNLGVSGGMAGNVNVENMHEENVAYLLKCYTSRIDQLMKVRDLERQKYMGECYGLPQAWDKINGYCHDFGIKTPALPHGTVDCAVHAIEAEHKARNTPEKIAKRKADAAKRKEAKQQRERAVAEATALRLAREKEEWQNHQIRSIFGWPNHAGVLLRLKENDPSVVETSQGATVPLKHAIKAFRFARKCKDQCVCWARNGHTIRVGNFQVDSIDTGGNMRAGCHYLRFDIVEAFAKAIGKWTETTPELETN